MARNLENSTSENSNIQEMGPRRSTRLNMILGGATPPRSSTMATTTVTIRGEVHDTTTMAQIAPPRQVQAVPHKAHAAKATTQASHLLVPHAEEPTPAEQPTLVAQHAPTEQPTLVAQPAPTKQPTHVA